MSHCSNAGCPDTFAGTAAALCAAKNRSIRELAYADLRRTLEMDNVYFER